MNAIQLNTRVYLTSVKPLETNETNPNDNRYIPGACNMGKEEIQRRKKAGWIGLSLTILTAALLIWLGVDKWWRWLLFIPAMMSATGFIQAYNKFCVYFGFGHIFNFGEVGKTDSIEQAEFRAKDRAKAWQVLGYAIGVGIAVALIFYFMQL